MAAIRRDPAFPSSSGDPGSAPEEWGAAWEPVSGHLDPPGGGSSLEIDLER